MTIAPPGHETVTIVDRWSTAFNRHDAAEYVACYAADAVFEDVGLHRIFHGRAELTQFFNEWDEASPDSRVDVERIMPTDGGAVVTWTGRGTLSGEFSHLSPTAVPGSRIELRAISVLEISADGLIQRHTDYYDVLTLLRQIGVVSG
ncbi:hypothetical protein Sme01_53720 [Sphaerisporangium melleum]|uniref:SnoaL-like domain-containing protein n=1 Tax=Sphaerisporangium melleum TaxID=321316 RepID=A0A917R5B7_9ACTN|nr:nuclear transport factor 2 family protein [Sphaerisporangium melleum]GGK91412.1 hypothetical protein GCM10007964_37580 [Sphaerisporangium melleum]GII72896.1 hypothetical protein Sme01_53720 [Sphaerisporangium melleum]